MEGVTPDVVVPFPAASIQGIDSHIKRGGERHNVTCPGVIAINAG